MLATNVTVTKVKRNVKRSSSRVTENWREGKENEGMVRPLLENMAMKKEGVRKPEKDNFMGGTGRNGEAQEAIWDRLKSHISHLLL
jgi:hypothetical protein